MTLSIDGRVGQPRGEVDLAADGWFRRHQGPPNSGLPLDELVTVLPEPALRCIVTSSDRAGRLADRSLLRHLGWCRRTAVRFDLYGDVILVAAASSTTSITTQGHLRLPLGVRRRCRIEAGTRLLVAAWPDTDTLVVCTMAAVQEMVLARLAIADQGPGDLS